MLMAALFGSNCGYVGEPLPPALHIPQRVADLSAIERGSQIHVQFTLPTHTTESLDIRTPVRIELRIGPAGQPFDPASWEAGAKIFTDIPADQSTVKYDLPAAEWIGKDVVIAVRVFGSNGRTAGLSNLVTLSVVPPLAVPEHLQAADVREGVRLTWQGEAPHYRIYRRVGEEPKAQAIGETERAEYNDTATDYGTPYHYFVEGFRAGGDIHLLSDLPAEVTITTRDTYAPPVPAGVVAVPSVGSIELMWDRSTASDLAGYRVYRAQGNGQFEKLADTREAPSYSDHAVESGKTYRYVITAFDKVGNESEKSAPVAVIAQ
jgi:fibronectin type 3 domain-containing protein